MDVKPKYISPFGGIPEPPVPVLPRPVNKQAQGPLTTCKLREKLTSISDQDIFMPGMKTLIIPEFAGAKLDLLELAKKFKNLETVLISGPNLKQVDVPEHLNVQALDSQKISYTKPRPKLKMQVHPATGNPITRTMPGQSYYSVNPRENSIAQALKINRNGEANFSENNERIVCRHLALDWLWQEPDADKRRDHVAQRLGSKEEISKNLSPQLEQRFKETERKGQKNHLVGHSQWGRFMQDQFAGMKKGNTRRIIVQSATHAMGLLLKTREKPTGKLQYVAEFYDPNITHAHARHVETDPKRIASWTLDRFMPIEKQLSYFRKSNNGDLNERMVSCVELPDDLPSRDITQPLDFDSTREVSFYLSKEERSNWALGHHLLLQGLPLDVLWKAVKAETNSALRQELLSAKSAAGTPGLFMALQNDHHATVKAYIDGINKLSKDRSLTNPQLNALLEAKRSDGVPGLMMALQNGHHATVKAYFAGINELSKDRSLTNPQLKALLEAKRSDGVPGLTMALQNGHHATVKAYIDEIKELRKAGCLNDEQSNALLEAKGPDGASRMTRVMLTGHLAALTASENRINELLKMLNRKRN